MTGPGRTGKGAEANRLDRPATPLLPFKIHHIPTSRDHKALNRGTLGGLGIPERFISHSEGPSSNSPEWRLCSKLTQRVQVPNM